MVKTIKLNNNINIPVLGFGTLCLTGEEGAETIYNAIKAGYRHIDTAQVYNTEAEVGIAVRRAIAEGICTREELFITSKIDPHKPIGYKQALNAVESSLQKLNLPNGGGYIDLYLIHYPNIAPGFEWKRLNRETWSAFEECVERKLIKSIGVSNFEIHHLDELLKTAKIKPVVNQLNLSPTWQQRPLVKYCRDNDIACVCWSCATKPFDIVNDILGKKVYGDTEDFLTPLLSELSQKYKKTPIQIIIKWCLQKGFIPLVRTSKKERLIENLDVFDFEIENFDMDKLDALNARPTFPDFAPDISYTVWAYQQKLSEYDVKTHETVKFLGLPLLTYKYVSDKIQKYKLFGILPIIKVKKKSENKRKIYFMGIPVLIVNKKTEKKYRGIELIPDYTNL